MKLEMMNCSHCRFPIHQESGGDCINTGKGIYHLACYRLFIAPRCAVCRTVVPAQHHVDAWGEPYCMSHPQERVVCRFCHRAAPLTDMDTDPSMFSGIRCRQCRCTSIHRPQLMGAMQDQIVAWMRHEGMRLKSTNFPLQVVAESEIRAILGRRSYNTTPLGIATFDTRQCGWRQKVIATGIVLQYGMPEALTSGVLAHELTHVWLKQHGILDLPRREEEGICEWMAHRWYASHTTREHQIYARRIETNGNPIYGDGFREISALASRTGISRLRESLLRSKRLPQPA